MLIQLSGVGITEASGKLGGTVFSKNGGGGYCRIKTKPLNGQTSSQNLVRTNLTGLAQSWAGLTAAQQLAWNTFGTLQIKTNAIGHKSAQSGFNAYVEYNQRLLNASAATISVPPPATTVAPLLTLSLTAVHAGATTMTFTATPVPTGSVVKVQTTGNLSAGKSFVKNHFRTIEYLAAAATSPAILQLLKMLNGVRQP